MTTAQKIVNIFNEGWNAFTFTGGYAMDVGGSVRTSFEPAKPIEEKYNRGGRCIRFIGQYNDGSKIEFTWNLQGGSKVRVL